MLAGFLHGSRDVRIRAIPCPTPQRAEVLLRVRRVGICGSDIHYYQHGRCGAFVPTRPFILGHEFVGVVEELGAEVDRFVIGDRVVANPATSCGQCESCKSGRANLCPFVVMLGSANTTPPTNGAFAEYVVIAEHQCHRLTDEVTDAVAALTEPLSVALHAIHRADGVSGKQVLIAGAGPIGATIAVAARAYGASLIVISEPNDCRRGMALNLGIEHTLDPEERAFVDQAIMLSGGGFDIAFEASGAVPAVRQCFDVVCRGGSIVQIGTVRGNGVALPVNDLMTREISLIGTFRYSDEFAEAIRLLFARRVQLDQLITATFPLQELPQAMETACNSNDSIKVQVVAGER